MKIAILLVLSAPLLGCTAELRLAMRSHAQSTRAVAQTVARSAAAIRCASEEPPACAAALATLTLQSRTLLNLADALEQGTQGGL